MLFFNAFNGEVYKKWQPDICPGVAMEMLNVQSSPQQRLLDFSDVIQSLVM